MKKLLFTIICILAIYLAYTNQDVIVQYIMFNYVYKADKVSTEYNEYRLDYNYNYVQNTTNFKPYTKKEIINVIYSGLNNGWNKFSFFCGTEYENCIQDVKEVTNNATLLSNINNFVHPFNSYYKLNMAINSFGKIDMEVVKLYTDEEINQINNQVNKILNENTTDTMSNREKIKIIHDYIINHNEYDKDRANNLNNPNYTGKYRSHTAYGPLFEGYAICSGYSDLMSIFLDKLGVPNYKISTNKHVWNLVYLDGVWYHLDLTWDDPVVNTGEDVLLDKFFLITTSELEKIDTSEHQYDKNIYTEAS